MWLYMPSQPRTSSSTPSTVCVTSFTAAPVRMRALLTDNRTRAEDVDVAQKGEYLGRGCFSRGRRRGRRIEPSRLAIETRSVNRSCTRLVLRRGILSARGPAPRAGRRQCWRLRGVDLRVPLQLERNIVDACFLKAMRCSEPCDAGTH